MGGTAACVVLFPFGLFAGASGGFPAGHEASQFKPAGSFPALVASGLPARRVGRGYQLQGGGIVARLGPTSAGFAVGGKQFTLSVAGVGRGKLEPAPVSSMHSRSNRVVLSGAVREPAGLGARTELLYGAYLAGSAFAVAGSGLHHKICHVLGGAYDLPHAETHSVILPQVTAFLMPALPETAALIARAIGADDAAQGLFDLAQLVGSTTSLAEIGFRADALDAAVALVLEEAPAHNPRLVDERAVRSILTGALAGTRPAPLAVAA
jgi:hypothetical protein